MHEALSIFSYGSLDCCRSHCDPWVLSRRAAVCCPVSFAPELVVITGQRGNNNRDPCRADTGDCARVHCTSHLLYTWVSLPVGRSLYSILYALIEEFNLSSPTVHRLLSKVWIMMLTDWTRRFVFFSLWNGRAAQWLLRARRLDFFTCTQED